MKKIIEQMTDDLSLPILSLLVTLFSNRFSWPEMVKPYPAPYPSMDAFGISGANFGSGIMMQTTPLQS